MAGLNVLSRMLLAAIFVASGASKIPQFSFFQAIMMAHKLPMVPLLLCLTIAIEIVGGLLVATGMLGRLGATALILFLIPATIVFHTSASLPIQPADVVNQQINLMKNLAIMGGLLQIVVHGAGPGAIGGSARR